MGKDRFSPAAFTDRDTLLHLRVPFSYFLLPVFLFGISQAPNIHASSTLIALLAMHLFIYPASNLYNSCMDKDTGAIGGIEHPPPVTRNMYYVSIFVDVAGILICALAGWKLTLVMCGYIGFSKAYSWDKIRLKKYPYLGWLSVAFFQGGYTFMLGSMTATNNVSGTWFTAQHVEAMAMASLIIGGSYPLTQIYQHEEDGGRGDRTISYILGVRGTFLFSALFFTAGAGVALHYFSRYFGISHFLIFAVCLSPVIVYFSSWFAAAMRNSSAADFTHAMRMNRISATCTNVCFLLLLLVNQHIIPFV